MRKTAARLTVWLLALLAVLLTSPIAPAQPIASAPAKQRDLLAEASADHFWIARIARDPVDNSTFTSIVYREKWSGMSDWTQLPPIPDRVISMATSNGELLLVLSDGLWEIADGDDIRT